ncbi:hypothetical protein JHK86_000659 [Glycine max]|nr:hypothetical protein JHK86_000659 [Glycine max]
MKCPSSMHPLTVRKGRIVKYRNFSHGMSDFACKTKIVSTLYNLAETPCSTGFLVVVQSNVDKTNQSYYGDSKLCYLTSDGMHEGLVPLLMPAKATMLDKKCNPLLELGIGSYNTIHWNPKGKCILG